MAEYKRAKRRKRKKLRTRLFLTVAAVVFALAVVGVVLTVRMDSIKKETARLYPMEFADLIRQRAEENDLEPAYVAAVVLAESSYDPQAVSSVGAQGLMQIMPKTGEWIAGKFDETYAEGCLFNPETNLKYGCWYLGYLMRRYSQDKRCATAAYHSGQGTVDEWLKDPAYSSDGVTLDVIGGDRANTYVDRVLEYYEKYEKLYRA